MKFRFVSMMAAALALASCGVVQSTDPCAGATNINLCHGSLDDDDRFYDAQYDPTTDGYSFKKSKRSKSVFRSSSRSKSVFRSSSRSSSRRR